MKSQLKILVGQDYDHSAEETNSKHVIGAPEVLSYIQTHF